MKNLVTLVGFVGNTPEVRTALSGTAITRLSLATNRPTRDQNGEVRRDNQGRTIKATEWHRITCFNRTAQSVAEHIRKGAMLMVTGHIHYTRWTDREGIVSKDRVSIGVNCAHMNRANPKHYVGMNEGAHFIMCQKMLYLSYLLTHVGDPYGNRTRVSAVRGPRPNR